MFAPVVKGLWRDASSVHLPGKHLPEAVLCVVCVAASSFKLSILGGFKHPGASREGGHKPW